MVTVEAAVCGAVEAHLCYVDSCLFYFVHPIHITEGRLNDRHAALYSSTVPQRTSSELIIKLNQHLYNIVLTKN